MKFSRLFKFNLAVIVLFLTAGTFSYGQENKRQALQKAKQAISFVDEGKIEEGIELLKEAQKLDPDEINYPYELAYAYYSKGDYKQASKYLEGIIKHKDRTDHVYQLLGNSYDILGKSKKAVQTYEDGLKLFPKSGCLYLELGIIHMMKDDGNKAFSLFEKGIQVEPEFPSNYYWATKLYCNSSEAIWGMIYGELFLNLESKSKRSQEISKLLYDTYKKKIQITSDSSMSVNFSRTMSINIADLTDPSKIKLPFSMIYEPTLLMSTVQENTIDIHSLNRIRKGFIETYFQKEHNKTYPNILFDYQNQVLKSSNFEAYNYWLLQNGDEEAFAKWKSENKDKWEVFLNWFGKNRIPIDDTNKFYSGQY